MGVRLRTRRVTNWKQGSRALRWASTAYLHAEQRFRKIIGYRDLGMLQAALDEEDSHAKQVLAA